jgi:hypothetical protein
MSHPSEPSRPLRSGGDDEQLLIRETLLLKQQYEQLAEIVETMRQEQSRNVEPISGQMKCIKETESRLRPMREAFTRSGKQASKELKQATEATIRLVETLMPKLAELEKASVDSLRRLFPKIQGSVRAVQMQNAYKGNAQV